MTEELASIYRDARHYDVLAQLTAPADLPFYRQLAASIGGPILELGCGTGRVALDLARSHRVVGVDRAAPLLTAAADKARAAGIDLPLHLGDFRRLDLGQRFRLVIIPYNAFNHLLTLADVSGCLGSVARHLEEGGRLVIDTFQPDPKFLARADGTATKLCEYRDPYSRQHVELSEENRYDAASQVNSIVWRYRIDGVADARVDELPMRIFFPQELDALLALHGWEILSKLGSYQREPFGSTSSKQLVVCTPR